MAYSSNILADFDNVHSGIFKSNILADFISMYYRTVIFHNNEKIYIFET